MQIAGLSTAYSAASVASDEISMKVLAKTLDAMETMGDGMQKMLEMSVTPHIGGNIDVSV